MPYRKTPIVSGEIYHVFNRSIAKTPIFRNEREFQRFISLIKYYRLSKLPLRFSHYNRLPEKQKLLFEETFLNKANPIVEIYTYCIMPNHFHFLIKPLQEDGVSIFMRKLQDSYSKFFNIKSGRDGSLFQFMFKAVHIETDEQFLHVSRYIHLNPVTAYLIRAEKLSLYNWSSFPAFTSDKVDPIVNPKLILEFFSSKKAYEIFTLDQVDYQRELNKIKHLILE